MIRNRTSLVILISTFVLVAIGHVAIYSASSYSALKYYGDSLFFVKKQLVGFLVGLSVMIGCILVDVDLFRRFNVIILIISIILLGLVFVPGIGIENYGAKRWLNLGFITLQPSELSKFALVIFISACMSKKSLGRWRDLLPILIVGGIMCLLLMMEPNMSITVCTLAVMVLLLLIGGVKFSKLALTGIPLVVMGILLILTEPYRLERLMAFMDPWRFPKDEGYQLIQSYYAIGSGGLFGVGLFNSRQKYLFLPFAESDFIFSVICEETGLFGAIVVSGIFLVLIISGIIVSMRATTHFESYMSFGISAVIAVQTLLNVAVVSGSIPPTGLPLPYISAGGSALAVFMAASGMLINISNRSKTHAV